MSGAETSLLRIENLSVSFGQGSDRIRAVRSLNLEVENRKIHALVGESGAGKSVTARAIPGLLPETATVESGSIRYCGTELTTLDRDGLRSIRGAQIGMVFQDPGRHLNPSLRVGRQVSEGLEEHLGLSRGAARARALRLVKLVELSDAHRVLRSYPHELSGGMKQRALIAMAISCAPGLLIADEPTTALDATVQGQILRLLKRLRNRLDMGILFVSHDFGVVQAVADHVSVIYAGGIVESASAGDLFEGPLHPYTDLLISAIPEADKRGGRLRSVPGRAPDPHALPPGCPFHPRCPLAREVCCQVPPPLVEHAPGHLSACHFAEELRGGRDG
ncbi:MAG: ATP-binding cassette domain-containing protein [Spirochaetes bacterium]|jgi:oligopeptide/dipeptide ABC transporter ATP-binding protein|nr:ATP-binding cassette domain-containing protein [Spirochaetota bacterium]